MRLKTYVFTLFFLLIYSTQSWAQNSYEYTPTNDLLDCINSRNEIIKSNSNLEQIVEFHEKCIKISKESKDPNDYAWALMQYYKSLIFINQKNNETFNNLEVEIKKIADSETLIMELESQAYYLLAIPKIKDNKYHQALELLFKSIESAKDARDTNGIIKVYNQILPVYNQLEDITSLKSYYYDALSYLPQANNYWKGSFYLTCNDLLSAFTIAERRVFLKKAQECLNNSNSRSKHKILYVELSIYYADIHDPDSSLIYLNKAKKEFALFNDTKHELYEIHLKTAEAGYQFSSGNTESGFEYINEAIELASKNNIPFLKHQLYNKAIQMAEENKEFEKAFYYQKDKINLLDSTRAYKRVKKYESLLIEYDTQKKEKTIQTLEKDKRLQNLLITQKDDFNTALSIVLALSTLLFVAIVILYIQKRRASQKLKSLNTLKDQIFSVLSHDLRSPMYSFNQLIELGKNSFISKEQFDEYLLDLQSELKNTNNLIQGLLRWAHANKQMLDVQFAEVNLEVIIYEIVQLYHQDAKRKNISIITDLAQNSLVHSDTDLLQFIVRNIFSNALKFSKENTEIRFYLVEYPNKYEIIVQDQGIGFTDQQIVDFHQGQLKAGVDDQGQKSIGLGLLLSKDFADKLKIKVKITSDSNGTTFVLSIPTSKTK